MQVFAQLMIFLLMIPFTSLFNTLVTAITTTAKTSSSSEITSTTTKESSQGTTKYPCDAGKQINNTMQQTFSIIFFKIQKKKTIPLYHENSIECLAMFPNCFTCFEGLK